MAKIETAGKTTKTGLKPKGARLGPGNYDELILGAVGV